MKLVEEVSGVGELARGSRPLGRVSYRIRRYQGFMPSGLPVPGVGRIEGSIDFDARKDPVDWIGAALTLVLEDGRAFEVTLAGSDGRIVGEGHGASRCLCC